MLKNIFLVTADHELQVRILATSTLAALVRLLPLYTGPGEPEGLSAKLREMKVFLWSSCSTPGRQYRIFGEAGISWLALLTRHGIAFGPQN